MIPPNAVSAAPVFEPSDGGEIPECPPLKPTVGPGDQPGNTPDDLVLRKIQGNILKSHGRAFTRLVLFRFDRNDTGLHLREMLREAVATEDGAKNPWGITSAHQQWRDALQAKKSVSAGGDRTRPFYGFGLTLAGMKCCGYVTTPDLPIISKSRPLAPDESLGFGLPMNDRNAFLLLGDFETTENSGIPRWEKIYQDGVDGLWLLAHDDPVELDPMEQRVTDLLAKHRASKVHVEAGFTWKDATGKVREPFGFRDGISNPLFFDADCQHDAAGNAYVPKWINIPRSNVLLEGGPHDGGSFMVLRKLEQNVKEFRKIEDRIEGEYGRVVGGATPPAEAGALIIGRHRNGKILVDATGPDDVDGPNRFDFQADSTRCPFHAHIRKAVPRTDLSPPTAHSDVKNSLNGLFVRRSAVYDTYRQLPPGSTIDDASAGDYLSRTGKDIEGHVGLLFMGYMSAIRDQFVRMQMSWFGDLEFPLAGTRLNDPVVRPRETVKGSDIPSWRWPTLGDAPVELKESVTPKGGAYFYMPSITWLEQQWPLQLTPLQKFLKEMRHFLGFK